MFKFKERFASLLSAFTVIRLKVKIIQTPDEIFLTDRKPAKAKSTFNKSVFVSFRVKDPTTTVAQYSDTYIAFCKKQQHQYRMVTSPTENNGLQ
jgi:hypothetical protein